MSFSEGRAISHASIDTDLDVSSVDDKVSDLRKRTFSPLLEACVEFSRQPRDLSGTDF
jgi:hypothetical protein